MTELQKHTWTNYLWPWLKASLHSLYILHAESKYCKENIIFEMWSTVSTHVDPKWRPLAEDLIVQYQYLTLFLSYPVYADSLWCDVRILLSWPHWGIWPSARNEKRNISFEKNLQ